MLNLDQIMSVAFPAVTAELLKNRTWTNDLLEGFTRGGGLTFMSLGRCVERWGNPKLYPVQELSVPMVWGHRDETANPKENQRISFAKAMMENVLWAHDDALASLVSKDVQIVVSKHYHRYLTDLVTIPMTDDDREDYTYTRKLVTAYAVIPR